MSVELFSAWFAGIVFGLAVACLIRWHWLDWELRRRLQGPTDKDPRTSYRASLQGTQPDDLP